MQHSIEIKVKFRYGHRLIAPYQGKCNNVHGEGGTAIFKFSTKTLDECGMVMDFGAVKRVIKTWVDIHLDHTYIHHKDDRMGDVLKTYGMHTYKMEGNPTAENIAKLLFQTVSGFSIIGDSLVSVGVVESFNDSVAYYTV